MYLINLFFIYSFLGFLFESILVLITGNYFFNSGILYGPWTFIYGIAGIIIMLVHSFLKKFQFHKWKEVILFYILTSVIMTLLELGGGIIIEKLFHVVYWNYTNMHFNIGYYICLEVSLFWGLFATLINYLVAPFLYKFAKKVPKFVTFSFVVLFLIDIIATIFN